MHTTKLTVAITRAAGPEPQGTSPALQLSAFTLAFALALALTACPPPNPGQGLPPCGVTEQQALEAFEAQQALEAQRAAQQEQGLFLVLPDIAVVLEGGTVCTPGTTDECSAEFETCDVETGDVVVGEVRRELVFFQAANIGATIFDARIEGDCPDIYIENFIPGTFVSPGFNASITLVVAATAPGGCGARLVIETDAANAPEQNPQTGFNQLSLDVRASRIQGDSPGGCTPDVACCCDFFTASRSPPTCDDDGRLGCPNQQPLLFTDQCDLFCGAAADQAWLLTSPDPSLVGPVLVGGLDAFGQPNVLDDILVLHPEPCAIERVTASGASVWNVQLSSMTSCIDMARAGDATVVVTGDGTEATFDPESASEGESRGNEGRTAVAASSSGAVLATRRAPQGDLVVRRVNSIGTVTGGFEIADVAPDRSDGETQPPHFVGALDNGDVVLAFARHAGSGAVDVPSAFSDGVFTLGDGDATVLLHVDDVGAVKRAFVVQTASAAHLEAAGDAYILCGGTDASGAAVEIGETGTAATALGTFDASRGFFVHVGVDGAVTLDIDPINNVTSSCAFDPARRPVALATSNTGFVLRAPSTGVTLMLGSAVGTGVVLNDQALVVTGAHGGIANQELLPQFPINAAPIESGSFLLRVPVGELGL